MPVAEEALAISDAKNPGAAYPRLIYGFMLFEYAKVPVKLPICFTVKGLTVYF